MKIIFIHGMFMNPKSWRHWCDYFALAGFESEAPAWPLHEGEPENLRAYVPDGTVDIELQHVMEEYENAIAAMPEKPVLIGHSVGGLIAQVLLNRGKAAAAVAISSVAPNAMLSLDWHFLKSAVPLLNPIKGDSPQEMTPEKFHQSFANTSSTKMSNQLFETFAVHESRNVLRSTMGESGKVDLDKPHGPLLFLTGDNDHIVPISLVQKNYEAYPAETGVKDLEVLEGKDHALCISPGWEKVGAHVVEWLKWVPSSLKASFKCAR